MDTESRILSQDIQHIKEWIAKSPHLPQEHEDVWLDSFLKGCKYSVERCKEKLEKFYTVRSVLPQYFNASPTSDIIRQSNKQLFRFMLPDCTVEGQNVWISGLFNDLQFYDLQTDITRYLMISIALIKEQLYDVVHIIDSKYFTMANVSQALPYIKDGAQLYFDALPIRMKQTHLINVNPATKLAISTVLPLLKEKHRNRIIVHTSDLESLYKYIPKEMLPKEYGGESGTIKELNDAWQNKLEGMDDFIKCEYGKKTDESKRSAESKKNDMFGIEGSFRTLGID